ncbi:hypothetical protein Hdeb2414_s0012g00389861 [Helianthus debilis subsp. tardiflorus]
MVHFRMRLGSVQLGWCSAVYDSVRQIFPMTLGSDFVCVRRFRFGLSSSPKFGSTQSTLRDDWSTLVKARLGSHLGLGQQVSGVSVRFFWVRVTSRDTGQIDSVKPSQLSQILVNSVSQLGQPS